jgi:hypothetical protein
MDWASGLIHAQLYPTNEGPRYVHGHTVTLCLVAWAVVVYGVMSFHFARLNRQRAAIGDDSTAVGLNKEEIEELGDRNPRYVYTL